MSGKCDKMNKSIKERIELWQEIRLLKTIEKEIKKRNKLRNKLYKQDLIVSELLYERRKRYLLY